MLSEHGCCRTMPSRTPFVFSLPGFPCSLGKHPCLPPSQTAALSPAQRSRQTPWNRRRWQTLGAWTCGGCKGLPRSVQRRGSGSWVVETRSGWKRKRAQSVIGGNPKEKHCALEAGRKSGAHRSHSRTQEAEAGGSP